MSTKTKATSRKYVLWSVLLVLLTFPHDTFELGLKFGGGGTSDDDAATLSSQLTKRHVAERKFKFRRLERIIYDENGNDGNNDDNNNNNDDDDDDDNNKPVKRSNKKRKTKTATGDDDDGNDDDEDVSRRESRYERASADSSSTNEAEEWQFERVQKVEKTKQKSKELATGSSSGKSSKQKQKHDDDENNTSFFGKLFSWFGSDDKDTVKKKKRSKALDDDDDDDDVKSNSIIDWLQWFGKKLSKSMPKPKEPPKDDDDNGDSASWISYFDRWPFNRLFPISKAIEMSPRRTAPKKRGVKDNDCDDDSCEKTNVVAPMSQDHFESLLHTLPGFVVNASHVGDIECKQQLQIFHRQLRGNKLWTLQMLDASGKISSGVLRGNINQFGDFDLCTKIRATVKVTPDEPMRIRGKYCLAHIEVQAESDELKVPVHLAHGRGLWNSHLGNPNHFAPRYAIANWGICIPHQCTANVVREMIQTNLRPYNKTGVEFHIEIDDDDCSMRQSKRFTKLFKKDEKFALTIFYIAVLSLLMVSALFTDYWTSIRDFIKNKLSFSKVAEADTAESSVNETEDEAKEEDVLEKTEAEVEANVENAEAVEDETTTKSESSLKCLLQAIFKSFSPNHTLSELLSQERTDVEFPIFHLLKLGATFMLYVCLKYLMIGHLPITNRDKLVRIVDQPFSIVFRSPIIYSDILLMISGFLSAYQLSEEMTQKNHIQLLKRLAAKILRYLPTIYIVLCFQTWILPHLGSGPLWNNLIVQNSNFCEQQMWRNVFSVQNAIDFEETCSPMTIQLALEVQLFLLGPLIVWLYYTDSDAGFFIYGAIHAMSVAARYARTNREHLSTTLFHGMNVSKFYRTANMMYSSPISRATPYLLGIGAGLLYRSESGNLDISPDLVLVGWLLCGISIVWCFWSPSSGMRSDYIYSSADAASYASWSPIILGLALAWIIFMFPKDEKSTLCYLSISRPILFLSRISFPMQLVTFLVVLYNTASVKDASKYHINDLVNPTEICLIIILAIIVAFLIDVPAQNVRRLLVQRLFAERPPQEHEPDEPVSGSEQADVDSSEKLTSDTPEPAETVWSSDPEEEEQRYLTRRRSSTSPREDTPATKTVAAKEDTEEDEESEEIAEEAEVKRRPAVPSPPPPVVEEKPAPKGVFTRRRRPTSDD